jgi:hypothetical protein
MSSRRSGKSNGRPASQLSRRHVLRTAIGSLAAGMTARQGVAETAEHAFHRLPKSMWVWNTSLAEVSGLREFALQWNIGRVLLGLPSAALDRLASGDRAAIAAVQSLREHKIEVVALTGDPSWAERRELPRALAKIFEIESRHRLFDGVDLDVEPHTLAAWRAGGDQRERLMLGLLELLQAGARDARGLAIGAALHPTYAKLVLPDGGNFLEALCRSVQSVSLMAYRDRPKALVSWSEASISIFERIGVTWRSGVLVHETKEAGTSFVGSPRPQFLADMANLDSQLRRLPASSRFQGLIFEDYKGLRRVLVN